MAKIISQNTIFSNDYLRLVENKIDFGKNVIKDHVDVYRKPAVSIFPITNSYEIYLIKQYRYLYQKELLEAIAGIIDKEGQVIETARRELKEEAGIIAKDLKEIRAVFLAGSFISVKQHLILAKDLSFEEATPEETESIKVIKMNLDEAVEKVINGEISTASSMLGIMLLDNLRKRGEL